MKTFLGFTTGVLTGFIATCTLVAYLIDKDPETFKKRVSFRLTTLSTRIRV